MGTHPIFESDFDCLTEIIPKSSGTMEYLIGCIGFMWTVYLLDAYLDYRQLNVIKKSTYEDLNALLKSHFPTEFFRKSQSYAKDKANYGIIQGAYEQLKNTAYIVLFVTPWFWRVSGELAMKYGFEGEYYQTISFLAVTTLFETVIGLPWSLYSNFVLEEKHGFNNMTLGFYFKDKLKKLLIMLPLNSAITCGIVWTVKAFGEYFYLYAWGFVSVMVIVMMYIYPEFIAPLFDTYSPLKDGALKEKIEALASKLEFPLTKLYVVDGSKRSNHSNAYMYGFRNNKRIVLFDTLIASECTGDKEGKGCEDDEIVAVLGHELGHWKMGHTVKMLVIQEALIFAVFYFFSKTINNTELFEAFGFTGDAAPGTYIKLMVALQTVMAPLFEVVGLAMTLFIRSNEFEADRFAIDLNYGPLLESALAKLFNDNKGFPLCDSWYAWKHHTHPHFNERVTEIRRQIEMRKEKTK